MAKMTDTEKLNLLIRDDPEISGKMYARMKMHINEATVVDADKKWIPVTEMLPSFPERVLVRVKPELYADCMMDTDRRKDGRWVRWGNCVTHWMHLPEPPKEEEDGD